MMPPGHQAVTQAQMPPIFGVSEFERLRVERDEYRSLYTDSNWDLNHVLQTLNHVSHQFNAQDLKIQSLQAELHAATTRYEGTRIFLVEVCFASNLIICSFRFLALQQQHNNLCAAGALVVNRVNARGITLPSRLQDVRERAQEIALHGVRHGAAVAFASAQVCSGHELRHLPPRDPSHHISISIFLNDFADEANVVALHVNPGEVINKVFDA